MSAVMLHTVTLKIKHCTSCHITISDEESSNNCNHLKVILYWTRKAMKRVVNKIVHTIHNDRLHKQMLNHFRKTQYFYNF
jgi:hypothetical protein